MKKCGIKKEFIEFEFRKDLNSYRNQCRLCVKKRRKKYYNNHREKIIEKAKDYYNENVVEQAEYQQNYRDKNKEKLRQQKKDYYEENKEELIEKQKEYYKLHIEEKKIYDKEYIKDNKELRNRQAREYIKQRRHNDISFKILCNLRTRTWRALKGKVKKSNKTIKLVGCSIEFLKKHLEKQFTEGMNWDNYGKWHVDHIKPCASFDLTKESEQRECFHYTNLQPLWAKENLSKGRKII